jgi:hypothetical protein
MHARELKKGSAELLILSLVEARARHGYEIGKLIEQRSNGAIRFSAAALYPLLRQPLVAGFQRFHEISERILQFGFTIEREVDPRGLAEQIQGGCVIIGGGRTHADRRQNFRDLSMAGGIRFNDH